MSGAIKHISRAEMEKLLDERCPTMSAPTRKAVLSGSLLELADGSKFKAPDAARDGKPTHQTGALIGAKDSLEWNN